MNVQHNKEKRRFELYDNDLVIGYIKYKMDGDKNFVATETQVDSNYGGKGYARNLVDALVNHARENKVRVVPICPYVIHLFQKYPTIYKDVF
jgi:predicted GNAT family acetyltransferase